MACSAYSPFTEMFIRRRRPLTYRLASREGKNNDAAQPWQKARVCAASNVVQNRLAVLVGGGVGGGLLLLALFLGRGGGIVREGNGNCAQCERQTKHQRHQLSHV